MNDDRTNKSERIVVRHPRLPRRRRKAYAQATESVRDHFFVPRRSGQKEGIFGPEGLVPAIHTGRKFS